MDLKKNFRININSDALAHIVKMQDSISHATKSLYPALSLLNEEQLRFGRMYKNALAPMNSNFHAFEQLTKSISQNQSLYTQIAELHKFSNALYDYGAVASEFEKAVKRLSQQVDFYKIDTFLKSVHETARLYDFSRIDNSLTLISGDIFKTFQPSVSAFETWRHAAISDLETEIFIPEVTPIREQLLTTDLLGSLQEKSIYEGEVLETREVLIQEVDEYILLSLPEALNQINPSLYRLWEGAWGAMNSNNPDKIRHTLVSVRELVMRVVHELAPDNQLVEWSTDEAHFQDGRPTRRARLLFIASNVNSASLRDYLLKEIEASLALMQLFNAGTHVIESSLNDAQLKIILRKAHSIICSLVEMRNSGK